MFVVVYMYMYLLYPVSETYTIAIHLGLLTTPQLHYIVRCLNSNGAYGEATEEGYYKRLLAAFDEILPEVSFSITITVLFVSELQNVLSLVLYSFFL